MLFEHKKVYKGEVVTANPYLDTSFGEKVESLRLVIRTENRLFDCYKYDYLQDGNIKPGDMVEFEFALSNFARKFEPMPYELASLASITNCKIKSTLNKIKDAFDETYRIDDLKYLKCPNEHCFSAKVFEILKENGFINKNSILEKATTCEGKNV